MSIERNKPCPCGEQKKFKQCCGRSADATHDLFAAVHEVGHASLLPKRARPHVSFQNPCSLCAGYEGNQLSRAHNGYSVGTELTGIDEILYSLGGGAAEVACGLAPVMQNSEFGSYPASMANDLQNLNHELKGERWDATAPLLRDLFMMLVAHFQKNVEHIWIVARRFLRKKVLTSDEINVDFIDRDTLVRNVAMRLGIPESPDSAIE